MREGPCWVPGTVVEILGPVSCLICVQNGEVWHRHIDHLWNGGASPPDTERVEAHSTDTEDDVFSSEPLVIQPSSEDSSFIVTQTNPGPLLRTVALSQTRQLNNDIRHIFAIRQIVSCDFSAKEQCD